ncbi:MAG TPA: methyltransferase domain-containing protein [Candidatus Thermoplasmatota archaeon]|nr:methyltransferase domain-containing protein [Candidatus Thermoplasmatota archaeon]
MSSRDRTAEGWSAVADEYDRRVLPFTSRYAADALRLVDLRAGERVLDVAAGSGAFALQAAQAGARVLATDFAPPMLARLKARARAEKLDVAAEVMDGQALALPDGGFDVAASLFGLIFFPDRARGFAELHRVLAPGGRVVVGGWSTPEKLGFLGVLSRALKTVVPDLPPPAEPPAILSLSDRGAFEREMRAAGFRDVRIVPVTHAWESSSPEEAWDAMERASPVLPALLAGMGAERAERLRAAVLGELREGFGAEPVRLESEALIGLGVK